jgi:hypothetical protein
MTRTIPVSGKYKWQPFTMPFYALKMKLQNACPRNTGNSTISK